MPQMPVLKPYFLPTGSYGGTSILRNLPRWDDRKAQWPNEWKITTSWQHLNNIINLLKKEDPRLLFKGGVLNESDRERANEWYKRRVSPLLSNSNWADRRLDDWQEDELMYRNAGRIFISDTELQINWFVAKENITQYVSTVMKLSEAAGVVEGWMPCVPHIPGIGSTIDISLLTKMVEITKQQCRFVTSTSNPRYIIRPSLLRWFFDKYTVIIGLVVADHMSMFPFLKDDPQFRGLLSQVKKDLLELNVKVSSAPMPALLPPSPPAPTNGSRAPAALRPSQVVNPPARVLKPASATPGPTIPTQPKSMTPVLPSGEENTTPTSHQAQKRKLKKGKAVRK